MCRVKTPLHQRDSMKKSSQNNVYKLHYSVKMTHCLKVHSKLEALWLLGQRKALHQPNVCVQRTGRGYGVVTN